MHYRQKNIINSRATMTAMNVYYDAQSNSYFKINKLTGEAQRANKDGSSFKKFKAKYSGSDYHLRKVHSSIAQQVERGLSPTSLLKASFVVKYSHKHTTPVSFVAKRANSNLRLQNTPDLYEKNFPRDLSASKVESKQGEDFQSKMRDFSRLSKSRANSKFYSARDEPAVSPQLSTPIKQDSKLALPSLQHERISKKTTSLAQFRVPSLSDHFSLTKQFKKQQQIFYKHHKQFVEKQNPRLLRQQKQHKINMKILQKEHLEREERATSRIYKHSD